MEGVVRFSLILTLRALLGSQLIGEGAVLLLD